MSPGCHRPALASPLPCCSGVLGKPRSSCLFSSAYCGWLLYQLGTLVLHRGTFSPPIKFAVIWYQLVPGGHSFGRWPVWARMKTSPSRVCGLCLWVSASLGPPSRSGPLVVHVGVHLIVLALCVRVAYKLDVCSGGLVLFQCTFWERESLTGDTLNLLLFHITYGANAAFLSFPSGPACPRWSLCPCGQSELWALQAPVSVVSGVWRQGTLSVRVLPGCIPRCMPGNVDVMGSGV